MINNNNNFPSPEKIIIAFVSVVILGMVAFAFSDTFKEITSPSKSGSSVKKEVNFERSKDNKIKDTKSNPSDFDSYSDYEKIEEKNSGVLSSFKKKFNNDNEDAKKVAMSDNLSVRDEYIRAYRAINKALEKEYKLYDNKTRINGNPVSKDKMHQMIQNQMTVTQIENDEMIYTTEGVYQYWIVGNEMGINIKTQGYGTEWRHAPFCHGYNECKKLNPNSFSLKNNCGKDNDYRLCPADNTGYSYVYNKTLKQVFDMFPDNNPNYYI